MNFVIKLELPNFSWSLQYVSESQERKVKKYIDNYSLARDFFPFIVNSSILFVTVATLHHKTIVVVVVVIVTARTKHVWGRNTYCYSLRSSCCHSSGNLIVDGLIIG